MIKVSKFGGSSVSDGTQFKKVKKIVFEDNNRKLIVVSAPGKTAIDDNKVTDLLYLLHAHIKYGVDYENIFLMIQKRFLKIKEELSLTFDVNKAFLELKNELNKNISLDYLVSRGEYFNALLMSEYLEFVFVDSKDLLKFKYNGQIDEEETNRLFQQALAL
ncbi:MAG: hypothetical protein WCR73_03585, partial [Acholeplasmataceae bacterium]